MFNIINTIVFVPTLDAKKSQIFYEKNLGFQFVSDDQFAVILKANGIIIRITKLETFIPVSFTILGWEVKDIEREILALKNTGILFERYPWMNASGLEIWSSPSGSKVAWFKDPDANLLSLTEI